MFGCCSTDELVYQVGDFTVDAESCSERLLALSIDEKRVKINEDVVESWGECVVRFGSLMCDATPAYALDELWCDGQ